MSYGRRVIDACNKVLWRIAGAECYTSRVPNGRMNFGHIVIDAGVRFRTLE